MAYSKDDKNFLIDSVCKLIESGLSLRKSIISINDKFPTFSRKTFLEWIDEDKEKSDQYARACIIREDFILDEIFDISDNSQNDAITTDDGLTIVNHEIVQRSKIRIDARKWALSKMNRKRFGDGIDLTSGGDKLPTPPPNIILEVVNPKPNE